MAIALPTKKKEAATGWQETGTWLVFGAPKVGKTELVSGWPECLLIDMEEGTKYIGGAYVLPVKSLAELRAVYDELRAQATKGQLPYKTIALDTVDVVNDWIEEEVCRELGITQMGAGKGFGEDWQMARTRALNLIKAFAQLPVHLLIVAHSRWEKLGEIGAFHTIDLPGKLARFTMAAVENVIFMTIDKGERKLVFKPNEASEAGSRHPALARAGQCAASYEALRATVEGVAKSVEPTPKAEPTKKGAK